MLKGLASILANNLSKGEREAILRTLDPALEGAKSAAAALTAELEGARAALEAARQERSSLEAALAAVQSGRDRAQEERKELAGRLAAAEAEQRARARQERHPIYGKLLHDFGYKRVFASEPRRLVDKLVLPVWERQRTFRVERARQIAKSKTADPRFGLPGVITIFDHDAPGKRGIVDGQHRIGGLEILLNDNKWAESSLVLSEVYTVGDHIKDVSDLFLEINQAQPALEVDLPGVADESVKAAIDAAAAKLVQRFPGAFSSAARPQPPNLNVDQLRQELFASDKAKAVIAGALAHGAPEPLKAADALVAWVLDKNDKLAARTLDEWASSKLVRVKSADRVPKAVEKCSKLGLFIGLDLSWL
jgi:hypothetical protein